MFHGKKKIFFVIATVRQYITCICFLDHHKCSKSGGYCRNNALQCDKSNKMPCGDGTRCCITDNGTVKREIFAHTFARAETLIQICVWHPWLVSKRSLHFICLIHEQIIIGLISLTHLHWLTFNFYIRDIGCGFKRCLLRKCLI